MTTFTYLRGGDEGTGEREGGTERGHVLIFKGLEWPLSVHVSLSRLPWQRRDHMVWHSINAAVDSQTIYEYVTECIVYMFRAMTV